jgi:hypothetical protein
MVAAFVDCLLAEELDCQLYRELTEEEVCGIQFGPKIYWIHIKNRHKKYIWEKPVEEMTPAEYKRARLWNHDW